MTEPWELTAGDALAAVRARSPSPLELLASVEGRADLVEPVVNALSERRHDDAVMAATESADRYARGEGIRALEGLPVALKEEVLSSAGACGTARSRSTRPPTRRRRSPSAS